MADIVNVHDYFKKEASKMEDHWWIWASISAKGVRLSGTMSHVQLFGCMPEVAPHFYKNFAVRSLTIDQEDGTKIVIQRKEM